MKAKGKHTRSLPLVGKSLVSCLLVFHLAGCGSAGSDDSKEGDKAVDTVPAAGSSEADTGTLSHLDPFQTASVFNAAYGVSTATSLWLAASDAGASGEAAAEVDVIAEPELPEADAEPPVATAEDTSEVTADEAAPTDAIAAPVTSDASMTDDQKEQSALTIADCDADGDAQLSEGEIAECQAILDAKKKQIFEEFDENQDGKLDSAERAKLKEQIKENIRAKRLELLDFNKDGKIDDADRQTVGSQVREAIKAFHADLLVNFDADGDGKLSQAERSAALEAKKKAISDARATILGQRDKDGDGNLKNELAALKDERKKALQSLRSSVLQEFDANKDGVLSSEERDAMLKARADKRQADRKQRLDTNQDGVVSPEELAAHRKARVEQQ